MPHDDPRAAQQAPQQRHQSDPFAALGLAPALARAASERGYEHPTPIQSQAIPVILTGADVLALAQTGSGKTAAYALPLMQHLLDDRRTTPRLVRVLILVPTRELASQVGDLMSELAHTLPGAIKVVTAFGGVSINPQMMSLRGGAEVVVATPGRLLDLIEHNALSLSDVGALVLDEADRLLDLGFAEELSAILDLLPPHRQNLFFSATFPEAAQELAHALLHEPEVIELPAEPETAPDIAQRAIEVDADKRAQLLRHLIKADESWSRVLVFAATKYGTELVAHKLHRAGIHAAAFHGDLSQGARRAVLEAFKASELQVVVATDVAARGIDIKQLPVVVNYDLPRSPAEYVHRIGRTGRAGESGVAVSFVTPDMENHFRLIEKRQGKRVAREQVPGFEPTESAAKQHAQAFGKGVEANEDHEGGEGHEDLNDQADPLAQTAPLHVAEEAEEAEGAGGAPDAEYAAAPKGLDPNGGIKGRRKSKKDKLREAAALAAAAEQARLRR